MGLGEGGGEMPALPAACSAGLCFTSLFLPPNLYVCRARGVSILPPHHSWHWSPAWWSISRWHVSCGGTMYCLGRTRTQPVSCKSHLFSQLFNSDLPNWQPLDSGPGLLDVRRIFLYVPQSVFAFQTALSSEQKSNGWLIQFAWNCSEKQGARGVWKDSCIFDLFTKLSEGEIISDFLEVFSSCPGASGETKIFFSVVTSSVFHFFFQTYFLAELGHIYFKSQYCALLMALLR